MFLEASNMMDGPYTGGTQETSKFFEVGQWGGWGCTLLIQHINIS